jgi:hypothetical protein
MIAIGLGPRDLIGTHIGKGSVASVNEGSGESSTFTAANGDMIYSTFTELPNPDPIVCPSVSGFNFSLPVRGQDNYTGGTGRFADASGTTVTVGCLYIDFTDFTDLTFPAYVTISATGTISY